MANIPTSLAEPNVAFVPNNVQYNANQFGAQTAEGIGAIGQQVQKVQDRDAVTWGVKEFSDHQINELQELQKAKETGDANFMTNYLKGYDERTAGYMADAPSQKAAAIFQKRSSEWKDVVAGKAIDFEVKGRQAEALEAHQEAKDNYTKVVKADPSQLPLMIQQSDADTNALAHVGRITPQEAESKKAQDRNDLSETAIYSFLDSGDPVAVKMGLDDIKAGKYDDSYFNRNPGKKKSILSTGQEKLNGLIKQDQANNFLQQHIGDRINMTYKLTRNNISLQEIQNSNLDDNQKNLFIASLNNTGLKEGDVGESNTIYHNLTARRLELTSKPLSDANPDTIKDFAQFLNDVQGAKVSGDIDEKHADQILKPMQKYFNGVINRDQPEGIISRNTGSLFYHNNPDAGIESLKVWANKQGYEKPEAKGELYKNYMKLVDDRKIDDMPEGAEKIAAITKAVNDSTAAFVVGKNPSLRQYETLPNSAVNSSGQKTLINPNPNNAKTDGSITLPVKPIAASEDGNHVTYETPTGNVTTGRRVVEKNTSYGKRFFIFDGDMPRPHVFKTKEEADLGLKKGL